MPDIVREICFSINFMQSTKIAQLFGSGLSKHFQSVSPAYELQKYQNEALLWSMDKQSLYVG